MQKVVPCLWFEHEAEEAMNHYMSAFDHGQVKGVTRWPEGSMGPAGTLIAATFEMFGQDFMVLNGKSGRPFNESFSYAVHCDTQEEIDRYWSKLSASPQDEQCGWLKDKYGFSWQIIPKRWIEIMSDPDPVKTKRALDAMMQMKKMDIAALEAAYNG